MTKPNIRMDWTVNISSLFSAIMFCLTVVGAWYNLRQEVAINKNTTELKFASVDVSIANLKDSYRTTTDEIKQDIRELRTDIKSTVAAPTRGEGRWIPDEGKPRR